MDLQEENNSALMFRTFLERLMPLSDDEWNYTQERFKIVNFPKDKIITPQGTVEEYVYFITKGIVRLFIALDEKEITLDIHFENDFANGYSSFLTGSPSHFSVHAITEVTAIAIHKNNLEEIYSYTKAGNYMSRKMAEYTFLRKAAREVVLLTQTPEERYLSLMAERPKFLQHIPLKYLASYLGVTPQALSRIRKRIN